MAAAGGTERLHAEVLEYPERIEAILQRLDEMIGGGLIRLEKVRVILYRAGQRD